MLRRGPSFINNTSATTEWLFAWTRMGVRLRQNLDDCRRGAATDRLWRSLDITPTGASIRQGGYLCKLSAGVNHFMDMLYESSSLNDLRFSSYFCVSLSKRGGALTEYSVYRIQTLSTCIPLVSTFLNFSTGFLLDSDSQSHTPEL